MSLLLSQLNVAPGPTPEPTPPRNVPPSAVFKYVKTVPRGQRVKVVRSFEV